MSIWDRPSPLNPPLMIDSLGSMLRYTVLQLCKRALPCSSHAPALGTVMCMLFHTLQTGSIIVRLLTSKNAFYVINSKIPFSLAIAF